jgi:transcriptional regulator with XRE-family HTH domain
MAKVNRNKELSPTRRKIAAKVRELRVRRGLTQTELAKRLHISQNRLSEIENGDGSFTAEQFLELLRLFNVTVSDFADEHRDSSLEIQNALARLGATHLHEAAILPSVALQEVNDVVREALLEGSPRIVTALAPVIAKHADKLNLPTLYAKLYDLGMGHRLGWVLENTLVALDRLTKEAEPEAKAWKRLRRRAEVPLRLFLDVASTFDKNRREGERIDVVDPTIRSARSLEDVKRLASEPSRRWGVVSSLQPDDFVQALRASRAEG